MRVVDLTQWYSPVSGGIRTYLRAKAEWAARHSPESTRPTFERPGASGRVVPTVPAQPETTSATANTVRAEARERRRPTRGAYAPVPARTPGGFGVISCNGERECGRAPLAPAARTRPGKARYFAFLRRTAMPWPPPMQADAIA